MKKFLKEYWIEVIGAVVILLGAFLIAIEPQNLRGGLQKAGGFFKAVFHEIAALVGRSANHMNAYDIFGGILVILAVAFIVWRVRYRFETSPRFGRVTCPKCSAALERVHRTWWDRLMGRSLFPHSRRFRCSNPDCGWTSLLRKEVHQHHDRPKGDITEPGIS